MQINNNILEALDDYHVKSLGMQSCLYDKTTSFTMDELKEKVNDDLIFHVPIYDMLDRKYAAFSSFPEALKHKEKDPKGNGIRFKDHKVYSIEDQILLLYLFRLCGSGINYKPESHGFGNFWIVNSILNGRYKQEEWLEDLPDSSFSDSKGYLLPMIHIGLRNYILQYSRLLVSEIIHFISRGETKSIISVVDTGNKFLNRNDFKKQNFVLSAFAADLAEYYPNLVDRGSMIYAGTNARKCIKAIFGKCKDSDAIEFLSKRYNSVPYSIEDSRLCDPIRYFLEYQSKYHIEKNNGNIYKNNSILKTKWTDQEYKNFQLRLQA